MSKAQNQAKAAEAAAAVEDDNPEGWPRFVSTTGQGVLIATTRGGHSASVGTRAQTNDKGTPLHPRFHRQAVMLGCMPIGLDQSVDAEETQTPEADRKLLIIKAMAEMSAEAASDAEKLKQYFTTDGRPDAREIGLKLGFPVSAAERDAAWDEYNNDGDDE